MKHVLLMLALAFGEHQGHVRFGEISVPGVSVQATQGDKKVRVITNEDGRYVLPDVEGTWTIQVEMPGFETLKQEVTVSKDSAPLEWNLKLKRLAEIDGEVPRGFSSDAVSTPTLEFSTPS